MPYTGNPLTNPIDEVRLLVGDTYEDIEVLEDSEYIYFLDKNSGNIKSASIASARVIMMKLSRWTRERTGDMEVYGSEWAKGYREALKEWIRNPAMALSSPIPYAGGISKSDMLANNSNADNNRPEFYIGMLSEGCISPYKPFSS